MHGTLDVVSMNSRSGSAEHNASRTNASRWAKELLCFSRSGSITDALCGLDHFGLVDRFGRGFVADEHLDFLKKRGEQVFFL